MLDFSITVAGQPTISGQLDGTLLGDGNTFDVTGIGNTYVNGVLYSTGGFVISQDQAGGLGPTAAAVTLDGSYLNVFVNLAGNAIWTVGVANAYTYLSNIQVLYGATTNLGGTGSADAYTTGQLTWTASIEGVPEPAALAVLPMGLIALGMLRARRTA